MHIESEFIMHLAIIDTKTHRVAVYSGKERIASVQFNTGLSREEVNEFRTNPRRFISGLEVVEKEVCSS